MKRFGLFVFIIIAVLGINTTGFAAMLPYAAEMLFYEDSTWQGYTILSVVEDDDWWENYELEDELEKLAGPGPRYAVIVQKGARNLLCIVDPDGEGYQIVDKTSTALHQGTLLPQIVFEANGDLIYTYAMPNGTTESYHAIQHEDGHFLLESVTLTTNGQNGGLARQTVFTLRAGSLLHQEYELGDGGTVTAIGDPAKVWGDVNARLSSFLIDAFPHTYSDALSRLTPPPSLAENEQQDPLPAGTPIVLSGSEPYAVYAGPDSSYAVTSSLPVNAEVAVIGLEANFLFVSFPAEGTGATHYGYIADSALETLTGIPENHLAYRSASATTQTVLSDTLGGPPLADIAEGTALTYLATVGDRWSFVELCTENAKLRGFVPSEALEIPFVTSNPMAAEAIITRDVNLIGDPYRNYAPKTLAALRAGDAVTFIANAYNQWAYVRAGDTLGFVPADAVETPGGEMHAIGAGW